MDARILPSTAVDGLTIFNSLDPLSPVGAILESYVIDAGSAAISVGGLIDFLSNGKVTASISRNVYKSGADVNFISANTYYVSAVPISSTQILLCYYGASGFPNAVVVTITGNVISYGTPLVIESAAINSICVTALTATTFLVTYQQATTGHSAVLTVSGTTVTTGAIFTFAGSGSPAYCEVTALSATSAVVVYSDGTNGKSQVLNISGTTITGNTAFVFNAVFTPSTLAVVKLTSTTVLVLYLNNTTNNYPTAQVLSISAGTITGGTPLTVASITSGFRISIVVISPTSVVVFYPNNPTISAVQLSISGTTVTINGSSIALTGTSVNGVSAVFVNANKIFVIAVNGSGFPCAFIVEIVAGVLIQRNVFTLWSIATNGYMFCVSLPNFRYFVGSGLSTIGVGSYVTDGLTPQGEAVQAGTAGQTINVYRF